MGHTRVRIFKRPIRDEPAKSLSVKQSTCQAIVWLVNIVNCHSVSQIGHIFKSCNDWMVKYEWMVTQHRAVENRRTYRTVGQNIDQVRFKLLSVRPDVRINFSVTWDRQNAWTGIKFNGKYSLNASKSQIGHKKNCECAKFSYFQFCV